MIIGSFTKLIGNLISLLLLMLSFFIFIIGFTRIRLFIFIVEAFSDYFLGGKLSEELFKGWSLIENQVYKSGSSIIGGKL
jgi:hypothetical protein